MSVKKPRSCTIRKKEASCGSKSWYFLTASLLKGLYLGGFRFYNIFGHFSPSERRIGAVGFSESRIVKRLPGGVVPGIYLTHELFLPLPVSAKKSMYSQSNFLS